MITPDDTARPRTAVRAPKPSPSPRPKPKPHVSDDVRPSRTSRRKPSAAAGVGAGAAAGAAVIGARTGEQETWLSRHRRAGTGAVIAHRGNVERLDPPNSIASLERAAKDGKSDAVEMDVQRLGDGTIVVYHDGDDKHIKDGDLAKMTRADLADHPQIPTLEQWARRAGELDVNVMAEFKESGYEQEALRILQRHLDDDQLAMMSFDPDAVRGVRAIDPRVPVALVISRGEDAPSVREQVDALGFDPDYVEIVRENINEDVIRDMTDDGIGIIVGKEDPGEQDALLDDPRITGLITNNPSRAAGLRDDELFVSILGVVLPKPAPRR